MGCASSKDVDEVERKKGKKGSLSEKPFDRPGIKYIDENAPNKVPIDDKVTPRDAELEQNEEGKGPEAVAEVNGVQSVPKVEVEDTQVAVQAQEESCEAAPVVDVLVTEKEDVTQDNTLHIEEEGEEPQGESTKVTVTATTDEGEVIVDQEAEAKAGQETDIVETTKLEEEAVVCEETEPTTKPKEEVLVCEVSSQQETEPQAGEETDIIASETTKSEETNIKALDTEQESIVVTSESTEIRTEQLVDTTVGERDDTVGSSVDDTPIQTVESTVSEVEKVECEPVVLQVEDAEGSSVDQFVEKSAPHFHSDDLTPATEESTQDSQVPDAINEYAEQLADEVQKDSIRQLEKEAAEQNITPNIPEEPEALPEPVEPEQEPEGSSVDAPLSPTEEGLHVVSSDGTIVPQEQDKPEQPVVQTQETPQEPQDVQLEAPSGDASAPHAEEGADQSQAQDTHQPEPVAAQQMEPVLATLEPSVDQPAAPTSHLEEQQSPQPTQQGGQGKEE